jgi:HK97 family phage portal protein
MNFVGESYIYMRDSRGNAYTPVKGQLPAALEIFPAHLVQFTLGEAYSQSTVRYGSETYPLTSVIRDLNPDPSRPYYGRSIVRASAQTLDTEYQMKEWNRRFFANNARPSLIFKTNEALTDEAYERWKAQFRDENTGTENAYKPLLIEGGDAQPYMLNQQDLDFLNSRKFSRDEILAMWRVSPGIIGSVENVNRSNLEAGFYIHAVVNIRPRIRQFVRQLNASLVSVFDPTLELGFEDPVPEDSEAKLKVAEKGVNRWWTIDEVREQYGDKPLPDKLGSQIYLANNNATLSSVDEGSAKSAPTVHEPAPAGDDSDQKSFKRKRQKKIGDVVYIMCNCCDGEGEHDTGFECYRCDASGWCTPDEDEAPMPCDGRKDSPNVWVDDQGRYRHAEEEKSLGGVKKKT